MKNLKKLTFVLMIATVMVILAASSVFANIQPSPGPSIGPSLTPQPTFINPYPGIQVNIDATNETGKTANDLEVFFKGNVEVLGYACSGNNPFQNYGTTYNQTDNSTKVRWYNGTVDTNTNIHFCVWIDSSCADYKYTTQWTFNTITIGNIGTALSHEFKGIGPGMVAMTIANYALDGTPETVDSIELGTTETGFSLATLFWNNLNQGVVWSVIQQGIHLNPGESKTFTIPVTPTTVGIPYRIRTHRDGDAKNIDYIGQFTPFPNWALNVSYKIGDSVTYNGVYFTCMMDHISQAGLEPPNAPAFWQPALGLIR